MNDKTEQIEKLIMKSSLVLTQAQAASLINSMKDRECSSEQLMYEAQSHPAENMQCPTKIITDMSMIQKTEKPSDSRHMAGRDSFRNYVLRFRRLPTTLTVKKADSKYKRPFVMYFDENLKIQLAYDEDMEQFKAQIPQKRCDNSSTYTISPKTINGIKIDRRIFHIAAATMFPENSYDMLIDRYYEAKHDLTKFMNRHSKFLNDSSRCSSLLRQASPNMQKVITNMYRPNIIRIPENPDKNTFDYIQLDCSLVTKETCPKRGEIIKSCILEIVHFASLHISSYSSFTKYGIPINFLRVTNAVITQQSTLRLTFELKSIDR